MEPLATTIRFVTLNCRTLSSELQQAALSRLLRYLCVPFAALQETGIRDRPSLASKITPYTAAMLTRTKAAKRKTRTLKLQLDYVLARNIPQSDIRKSRAVWDVAFDSDHRPVLSLEIRFHKRNRGVPLQPKIDMAGLKDDECRTKFRQRVSIHVGVRTRKKLSDADSFTKCIQDAARETLPVLLPRKNAGDFNQEKRLRRKLRRQLQKECENEWTSKPQAFEKVWEDKDAESPCSTKITLLNRLAPSAPDLEHVHRPTYAVNEEPPTESEVLVCIQKMKNGKSGGDDGISAEMLKYLPPVWDS
ncbi:hypothetical protein RB195_024923 [Necator americanus]|uniref:Endonuclease/exonuclease/phosphatase domain-containing protein n=1 Tax=Necator americanus TaxID=51031 RepID=A0ABR1EQ48_NECAM